MPILKGENLFACLTTSGRPQNSRTQEYAFHPDVYLANPPFYFQDEVIVNEPKSALSRKDSDQPLPMNFCCDIRYVPTWLKHGPLCSNRNWRYWTRFWKRPLLERKVWRVRFSIVNMVPAVMASHEKQLVFCSNDGRGAIEFFGEKFYRKVFLPPTFWVGSLILNQEYLIALTVRSAATASGFVIFRLVNEKYEPHFALKYDNELGHSELERSEWITWSGNMENRGHSSYGVIQGIFKDILVIALIDRHFFFIIDLANGSTTKNEVEMPISNALFSQDRFVIVGNNQVIAFSSEGERIFSISFSHKKRLVTICANDSFLCVYHPEGSMEVYSLSRGTRLNTFNLSTNLGEPSLLHIPNRKNIVYKVVNEGEDSRETTIYAVSIENGVLMWLRRISKIKNLTLLCETYLHVSTHENGWYLLDPNNGNLIWRGHEEVKHVSDYFQIISQIQRKFWKKYVYYFIEYYHSGQCKPQTSCNEPENRPS